MQERRELARHPVVVDGVGDASALAGRREVEIEPHVGEQRLLAVALVGVHSDDAVEG